MLPAPHSSMHIICDQSLHSSALELKYERSAHLVDILAKDEDIRRLRFEIHCLEDDNDELRELLSQEEDRSDAFEQLVNENLARAEAAEAQLQDIETDLRQREQELLTLQAEKGALQHSSEDATAALTEKLALIRELSILRPELEHMKAQAASTEALMTEKLALQRQLSNIQCEVENAKRDTQRALAKRRNTGVEIAQEEQMDDLRRQLTKEKRARQRAEEAADVTQSDVHVDDVRKELAREKRARQKAEEKLEEAQQATQVEDVRKDLLKEKKAKKLVEAALDDVRAELDGERKAAARAVKRADGNAEADDQAEELRRELAKEKKERVKAEKAAQQAAAEFEAQKATLDDKLNQFRNKLRTTKEKLKETETELATTKASAPAKPAARKTAAASVAKPNAKKRNAAQMEPDASALGTPGDGPAAKRGRKAASGVGDKSTFSITPFLNRTASVAPDGSDNDDPAASPAAKKKLPLADKSNVQPLAAAKKAQRKPKAAPALEMVTEEADEAGQENAAAAINPAAMTLKIKTKTGDEPDNESAATKQKKKIRKSITDFTTFNSEPEQVKKKRTLGGLGKTLFDEEEDAGAPTKTLPGRGMFGMKGFGGFGAVGSKKGGILGGARPGSTLLTAMDGSGFQFSPLKKSRRNLDDTLRG